MKNLFLTYLFIFVCLTPAVFAQQDEGKETATHNLEKLEKPGDLKPKFGSKEHRSLVDGAPDKIESTENILLKTCLALAAVIAVILIVFSLLKKINGKLNNAGTENPLRIKNKMVIDSKNYLALVRVYEEELLVAIGPNGTNLIAKYALVDKEEAEGTDFENVLNKEGQALIPMELENHITSVDMKPIRELGNAK